MNRRPDTPPPDICIGTDEQYTPKELQTIVENAFQSAGYTTQVNYPYAGCFIPNAILHHQCATDCISIMLEIHKRTYCDEEGNSIPEKLRKIELIIREIIVECVDLR